MRIHPEIDKIGTSLCNKSVSNIPPVIFAVFGTEDEVFLVQCAGDILEIYFLPSQCVCAPGGGEAVVHAWRHIMNDLSKQP